MTVVELNAWLDSYLAVRSALGFRLQSERTLLRSFIQFLYSRAELHPIRAQMAVEWACSSSATRGGRRRTGCTTEHGSKVPVALACDRSGDGDP